jgi:uncharacterized membrane protein (UPF0127 family)
VPPTARGPFGSHWVVPLSAAAVVVLSVGLVVFMDRDGTVPWRTEAPIGLATAPEAVTSAKREAAVAETSVSDDMQQKEVAKVRTRESVATSSAHVTPAAPTELAKAPAMADGAATRSLTSQLEKTERKAAAPSGNSPERANQTTRHKSDAITTEAVGRTGEAQSPRLPLARVIELKVGDRVIRAEVASTPEDQQRGLMFRESLAADAGMLFVFSSDHTGAVCMWMKNTTVALSAAFLDDTGRVLNIADMQPHSESSHCATGHARFVLEVNRGTFAAAGVKPGTRIGGLPNAP